MFLRRGEGELNWQKDGGRSCPGRTEENGKPARRKTRPVGPGGGLEGLARPFRVFNVLALVVLLLCFTNPYLMIPNVPALMALWLNLMHLVVAGVVEYSFNRWAVRG